MSTLVGRAIQVPQLQLQLLLGTVSHDPPSKRADPLRKFKLSPDFSAVAGGGVGIKEGRRKGSGGEGGKERGRKGREAGHPRSRL